MAAKITSREKNKRPRLVSLTNNLEGMISLIAFKDLQESSSSGMSLIWKPTYHGMGVYAGSASSLYFVMDDGVIVWDGSVTPSSVESQSHSQSHHLMGFKLTVMTVNSTVTSSVQLCLGSYHIKNISKHRPKARNIASNSCKFFICGSHLLLFLFM